MSSWTRTLAWLALLALAVAACGGGATSAPTSDGSAPPVASAAPSASGSPSTAPTSGDQGPDLAGAAAALGGLDSYRLRTVMTMEGLEESAFSLFGDGMEMEGTIIFRPTRAADISFAMGPEGQKTEMGYRLVGDAAWIRIGESWMVSTAQEAQSMIDSFAPDKLLGSFGGVSGLVSVGDESKNGIATTHYTAPGDAVGQAMGSAIGLAGATWTMDLWVANEAGYVVSYSVAGRGASGSFEMTFDISAINDPANTVQKPDDVDG